MKFIDKSLITSWREWGAAAFTEPVVVTGRDHFAFRALWPARTFTAVVLNIAESTGFEICTKLPTRLLDFDVKTY